MNQGQVERFRKSIGSKKETPNRCAVAGLCVLLACRGLQTGQPRELFLLALGCKSARGENTWLNHFQIQHDSLPFIPKRLPRGGILCVPITDDDQQWPILAPKFILCKELFTCPSTHPSPAIVLYGLYEADEQQGLGHCRSRWVG